MDSFTHPSTQHKAIMELHGYGDLLLQGTWLTIRLAITSLFFGLIFGLIGALMKLSGIRILRWLATLYTTIVRGLPELLVVFAIYFGGSIIVSLVAQRVFNYHARIDIGSFWPGVLALSVMFGAYATEVFRMAIEQIPQGQWESAQSLGMRPAQTFFRIIMPQLWIIALPALGNLFLVLLKDTALISLIGLKDLVYFSSRAAQTTGEPFTFYMVAALIYLLLTAVFMLFNGWAEWRANPAARYAKRLLNGKSDTSGALS